MPLLSLAERQLNKANLLLRERKLWTTRDVRDSSTLTSLVEGFKTRVIHFLLQLGSEFTDITRAIDALKFAKTIAQFEVDELGIPTGRYESVEVVEVSEVRNAIKLLIAVARRLKVNLPSNEQRAERPQANNSGPLVKPLSENDAKLHKALGHKVFETLTNAQIDELHRRELEPIIGRKSPEGFRASLKRIRAFHGYSSSKFLRAERKLAFVAVKNGQKR